MLGCSRLLLQLTAQRRANANGAHPAAHTRPAPLLVRRPEEPACLQPSCFHSPPIPPAHARSTWQRRSSAHLGSRAGRVLLALLHLAPDVAQLQADAAHLHSSDQGVKGRDTKIQWLPRQWQLSMCAALCPWHAADVAIPCVSSCGGPPPPPAAGVPVLRGASARLQLSQPPRTWPGKCCALSAPSSGCSSFARRLCIAARRTASCSKPARHLQRHGPRG